MPLSRPLIPSTARHRLQRSHSATLPPPRVSRRNSMDGGIGTPTIWVLPFLAAFDLRLRYGSYRLTAFPRRCTLGCFFRIDASTSLPPDTANLPGADSLFFPSIRSTCSRAEKQTYKNIGFSSGSTTLSVQPLGAIVRVFAS